MNQPDALVIIQVFKELTKSRYTIITSDHSNALNIMPLQEIFHCWLALGKWIEQQPAGASEEARQILHKLYKELPI